jgi:hypothetical protein
MRCALYPTHDNGSVYVSNRRRCTTTDVNRPVGARRDVMVRTVYSLSSFGEAHYPTIVAAPTKYTLWAFVASRHSNKIGRCSCAQRLPLPLLRKKLPDLDPPFLGLPFEVENGRNVSIDSFLFCPFIFPSLTFLAMPPSSQAAE